MNDDRKLLERAAKAAGMYVLPEPWPRDADGWFYNPHGNGGGLFARYSNGRWNPLTDDGDALRLAVKLGLFFKPELAHFLALERFGSQDRDDCFAYRRAIVRAAAALAGDGSER